LNIREIKISHNVQVGYFAQNQAEYLMEKSIYSNYGRCSDRYQQFKVRDMLVLFLFRGDDVKKKVKVFLEEKETV
jgi:ATP-binding cassette subfamily F protein 3